MAETDQEAIHMNEDKREVIKKTVKSTSISPDIIKTHNLFQTNYATSEMHARQIFLKHHRL